MNQLKKIAVIIPSYNEKNYSNLICSINRFIVSHPNVSFYLVNDGCPNIDTYKNQIVDSGLILIEHKVNKGKGASVKTGMLYAIKDEPDYLIFMDADLSYSLDHVLKIVEVLVEGYDVVIGSRNHSKSKNIEPPSFKRFLSSYLFNQFIKQILVSDILDTQCGLKGFTKQAASNIFLNLKTSGFVFDIECLILTKKYNLKLAEIPVTCVNNELSTLSFWRHFLKILKSIFFLKKEYFNDTPVKLKS